MRVTTNGVRAHELEAVKMAAKPGHATSPKLYALDEHKGLWFRVPMAMKGEEGHVLAFLGSGVACFRRAAVATAELEQAGATFDDFPTLEAPEKKKEDAPGQELLPFETSAAPDLRAVGDPDDSGDVEEVEVEVGT